MTPQALHDLALAQAMQFLIEQAERTTSLDCSVEECAEYLAASHLDFLAQSLDILSEPYPERVFTPLTDRELERAVISVQVAIGLAGSDRLYAGWARHIHKWLHDLALAAKEIK